MKGNSDLHDRIGRRIMCSRSTGAGYSTGMPSLKWAGDVRKTGQRGSIMERHLEEDQMTWQERIVVDPEILVGKPVIRGTRLAVELIVDLLAQGWSEEDILKNYPGLTREDVHACLRYASAVIQSEKVYPTILSR